MNDIAKYNRQAWDDLVAKGDRWTVPVSEKSIAAARNGNWEVVLTPTTPVPKSWFPNLCGTDLLGLASGGGQQSPIFAAVGANVTVLDNSPAQLEQDQVVARREGLKITSVLGDMRDLSCFPNESFDLVFNPCSICFVPQVQTVFDEAYRVLRPGGRLMCGFVNPLRFVFDEQQLDDGKLLARHVLPYSDRTHLDSKELEKLISENEPLVFSHSIEDLIRGQLRSGFSMQDLYEDKSPDDVISRYLPSYFATLSQKPT